MMQGNEHVAFILVDYHFRVEAHELKPFRSLLHRPFQDVNLSHFLTVLENINKNDLINSKLGGLKMSVTPSYTLADIMQNILTAIQNILGEVAKVIAENAAVVATVLVIGGVALLLWRYGSRIFRGITGLFRGLF
ncbi:MAG: hypothetical protein QXV75_08220 [Candidatus Bathyarchaeia archaeon]